MLKITSAAVVVLLLSGAVHAEEWMPRAETPTEEQIEKAHSMRVTGAFFIGFGIAQAVAGAATTGMLMLPIGIPLLVNSVLMEVIGVPLLASGVGKERLYERGLVRAP